jgi:hypothetical protein
VGFTAHFARQVEGRLRGADEQEGHGQLPDELIGHAAEPGARQRPPPVGGHDHQVRAGGQGVPVQGVADRPVQQGRGDGHRGAAGQLLHDSIEVGEVALPEVGPQRVLQAGAALHVHLRERGVDLRDQEAGPGAAGDAQGQGQRVFGKR